ncbi:MAG TPA: endolytic transglycosylase MltG [Geminicoccus sp.]|uniref:endolytic transglycosylase MltG n=1 Tax=Geminicoccus sp. TaxID=2024832 RepID=UPI002E305F31|nr:endolytic transglycosylase MltG [Geminicoccus sp.]HEX2527479.1 endolytic transglycosylase MltG [Geminicoccus sp.]
MLTAGLLLAACLVGGAFFLQRYLETWLVTPGPLAEQADIMVPRGTGMSGIAARLAESGVVDDALLLRAAARLSGRDRRLQAGEYRFPPHVTPAAALDMIANGQRLLHRITVPEGRTVREAWDLLAAEDKLEGEVPPVPDEGKVLPETYFFERGENRAEIAKRMQDAMRRALDEIWAKRADDLPFDSIEEAITLASIVEKETSVAAEYDVVAGVYVNRLRKGMPLQADPTVIYALTKGRSELGRPLSRRDLQVDDPYNTYRYPGLPPGPIALPGRAALAATVNPADTDYLYFVADGSGGHAFATTLDEHNRNVRNWRKVQAGQD